MWDRDFMYEQDIAIVTSYVLKRSKRTSLIAEAFSRWALDEILDRIWEETQKLPYHISGLEPQPVKEIIQEFIEEMGYYSSVARTENVIFFAEMAKDEAEKLLNKFL